VLFRTQTSEVVTEAYGYDLITGGKESRIRFGGGKAKRWGSNLNWPGYL